MNPHNEEQRRFCRANNLEYFAADEEKKMGISSDALVGLLPLHGLRHRPEGDATGWYIWANDYEEGPDFFNAMHVMHAVEANMPFVKYLGLPPGWRFLIGEGGYEDIWYDASLLGGDEGELD